MSPGLPFAHLNLRRNPFGEQDRAARVRTAVLDVAPLAAALADPGTAVQVRGPCGHGKTTHLLALHAALPEATYLRADTGGPHRTERRDVLLLDEADRVGLPTRWRLLRAARSVALATHRDLSLELRWLGFRVHTVRPPAVDARRLGAIVARRIEDARRGPGPVPRVGPEALATLLARHAGDLRAIANALYDRFQHLETADVEV